MVYAFLTPLSSQKSMDVLWEVCCSRRSSLELQSWFQTCLLFFVFLVMVHCREPLWEIPPMTRSWRKYQTGKAVRDPIHDEVMRKKPDRQGRLGWGTLQVGLGLYPSQCPPPFSAVGLVCPAADSCVACRELSCSSFTE